MSLPRELLDELLSGYMDGELSADERARVEQMLATDPAVSEALQLLQEQSGRVRQSLRNAPRLDDGFADRVLAATFAEAERLSLDPSHPVRRAAAGPRVAPAPLRYGHRYWVGALAVAASLAMAAVFLSGRDPDPTIVAVDPPPGPSMPTVVDKEQPVTAEGLSPSQLADSGRHAEGSAAAPVADAVRATSEVAASDIAQDDDQPVGDPGTVDPGTVDPGAVDPSMLADSDVGLSGAAATNGEAIPSPAEPPAAAGQVPLRAVLVYEVQLTPLGRERQVINRALREAEIRAANQRAVDEALVGYLRSGGMIGEHTEGDAAENAGISIMYLEGPGRRLEKLMLALLAASDEVQSVGFSLAMEPPVMSAVDSLRQIDPREIRSDAIEAVAHTLSLDSNISDGGRFTAGSRSFLPLQRDALEMLSTMGSMSHSDQPDITASTFLIIR